MADVYIYRRFSTDEQEFGTGDTLTRQSDACEAFARQKGWTVTEVLTDRGKSAFKGEHLLPDADLGKFLERVKSGEIRSGAILLAERLDRLSRRPVDQAMAWIHDITNHGIQIGLADTGSVFGANPDMATFLSTAIKAAQNHEESRVKSDRMRKAKTELWQKAEKKNPGWVNLAGRHPTWLERRDDLSGWDTIEERVKTIRDIYQWSADGLGTVKIVQRLNKSGIEPFGIATRHKTHRVWVRTTVRQFLNNPAVEGDFKPASGMFAGRVLHDFYPRIVDADVVSRARANQAHRSKKAGERAATGISNLFAGKTFCGFCGKPAFVTSSVQKGRRYTYMRCEAAGDHGGCANTTGYPYKAFEEAALDLCLDLALDDRFFQATGELREGRIRKAELEKAITDKKSFRLRLMEKFGESGDEEAAELLAKARAQLDDLTIQLAKVEEDIVQASGKVGDVEHLRRVGDIREAAQSENREVREQARSKLRQAMSAIVNHVDLEKAEHGEKVFELALLGGVLAARIDTKGRVLNIITPDVGFTEVQRAMVEPLLKRMRSSGLIAEDHAKTARS